jgi:hypothetical protein
MNRETLNIVRSSVKGRPDVEWKIANDWIFFIPRDVLIGFGFTSFFFFFFASFATVPVMVMLHVISEC